MLYQIFSLFLNVESLTARLYHEFRPTLCNIPPDESRTFLYFFSSSFSVLRFHTRDERASVEKRKEETILFYC